MGFGKPVIQGICFGKQGQQTIVNPIKIEGLEGHQNTSSELSQHERNLMAKNLSN